MVERGGWTEGSVRAYESTAADAAASITCLNALAIVIAHTLGARAETVFVTELANRTIDILKAVATHARFAIGAVFASNANWPITGTIKICGALMAVVFNAARSTKTAHAIDVLATCDAPFRIPLPRRLADTTKAIVVDFAALTFHARSEESRRVEARSAAVDSGFAKVLFVVPTVVQALAAATGFVALAALVAATLGAGIRTDRLFLFADSGSGIVKQTCRERSRDCGDDLAAG